eukprot:c6722_g1_i1.p1 GENE.c6722_g1_i1~~c6722_g1_i1.p1  ORF type:complete len:303 (+),score=76.38 c6722_g1_i1:26-934(+)
MEIELGARGQKNEETATNILCLVCCSKETNTCFPCGHSILCEDCSISLLRSTSQCPTCRKKFREFYLGDGFATQETFIPIEDRSKIIKRSAIVTLNTSISTSSIQNEGNEENETSQYVFGSLGSLSRAQTPSGNPSFHRRYRYIYLLLIISFISILQTLLFSNCGYDLLCKCNDSIFDDGSSCSYICYCDNHSNNNNGNSICSISSISSNLTNPLNITEILSKTVLSSNYLFSNDSSLSYCLGYDQSIAYQSKSCWRKSNDFSCEINPSIYVFGIGCFLLVSIFFYILIKKFLCSRNEPEGT